jgi:hypothetical protein
MAIPPLPQTPAMASLNVRVKPAASASKRAPAWRTTPRPVPTGDDLQTPIRHLRVEVRSHLTAPEGVWFGLGDAIRGGTALVYRITPSTAFGFGKDKQFSQTRWRFDHHRQRPGITE